MSDAAGSISRRRFLGAASCAGAACAASQFLALPTACGVGRTIEQLYADWGKPNKILNYFPEPVHRA